MKRQGIRPLSPHISPYLLYLLTLSSPVGEHILKAYVPLSPPYLPFISSYLLCFIEYSSYI